MTRPPIIGPLVMFAPPPFTVPGIMREFSVIAPPPFSVPDIMREFFATIKLFPVYSMS